MIWGKITYGDRVYLFGVFPIITGVLNIVPAICKWVNPLRTQQHMHAACSMQHAAQAVAHAVAPAVAQAAAHAHAAQAAAHAAAHIAASGRA